ncbi:MAG: homocysteine S-methyltransferase [Candidatus Contendobacter sp.]|jgi:homocysteine S-methyltransferase|nr:homocysteine S-methyltransferase [Gammaproteobacteria bacterium]MCC8993549.1 homocysteine S-methyltransferase [Candidatus Contendobacter sp.]
MNPLADLLQQYPVLVADGALATELERRGCDLRDPLWSAKTLIETPELIRQVHSDYFEAGADIAITASYQASIEGFMQRGLGRAESIALLQRSVRLAQEARDAFWQDPAHRIDRPRPLVAASVGPYGAFLADGSEYRGDYRLSEEQLMDFHRPRLAALLDAGPDLLACETIPCFAEARALARLLIEFPAACAWFSFTAKDDVHLCHGEPLAECAAWLNDQPQVVAVGLNCTAPGHILALIQAIRTATDKPVVVYPNSGETYQPESHDWQGVSSSASFAAEAEHWYAGGARIIGGCCRTTPEHIRAIAAWARGLPRTDFAAH